MKSRASDSETNRNMRTCVNTNSKGISVTTELHEQRSKVYWTNFALEVMSNSTKRLSRLNGWVLESIFGVKPQFTNWNKLKWG